MMELKYKKARKRSFSGFVKDNQMKKIFLILTLGAVVFGCNQEIEFDDFDYQSIYFPYQAPVRTLILGDESVGDNSIDLERAFSIGVSMGGAYENDRNRTVFIEYAPELAENALGDDNPLTLLPTNYYNATFDEIVIPSGQFYGTTRIDLTDEFFEDPLSVTSNYVIPVRILSAEPDSVLSGLPVEGVTDPDVRVADDWQILPKNYTLFGIKYINPTHGAYLLRGSRTSSDNETVTYSDRFLTDNDIILLTTLSMTENEMTRYGGTNTGSMTLTFDNDAQTLTLDSESLSLSGTGVYYTKDDPEAESYNGDAHRTIYMSYTYDDGGVTWTANDSLVFVDTNVVFEEFEVISVSDGD